MSDAEKKEPVKKVNKKTTQKPSSSSSLNFTSSSFIGFFIISLILFAGIFYLWQQQQQFSKNQIIASLQVEQKIASLQQQQIDATAKNENKISEIQASQVNLRHNLTNLIRNSQYLRNDWLMAEAEYLIQLANHRLLLEKDVATAMVALKAADARLAEVADPALLRIRKILNHDLHALSNVVTVDLAGLSVTLSSLSANIPNLPLLTPDPNTHKLNQEEKESSSVDVKGIGDLPAAIWKDIKSLVVIRNHEKPIEPLLAPNQHFFLVQNLGLLIEQSRLALLNGNNFIYHERLDITTKWINQYFDGQHNVTRNMLSSIKELQKLNIDPALPDISSTFTAIKEYRTKGLLPELPEKKALVEDKL